ncbi:MAG: PKD domain-containing protein [Thermoplasmata archaeon]|nr:PKD domain-containing protein [Thermoplasmata archaeon]
MKGRGAILFLLTVTLLVCMISGGVENVVEGAPTAYFTYSPEDPVVDDVVTFDASPSTGEGLQYKWVFEDGHEPTGEVVTHIFDDFGFEQIVLIVTNSTGGVDTYSENIHIDNEIDGTVGVLLGGILAVYLLIYLFYILVIIFFVLLFFANLILGIVLALKVYNRAKEYNVMDEAKPYLIAHIVAGSISLVMAQFALISIIAHLVIYSMFKSKMRSMGIDIKEKGKGASPGGKKKRPRGSPAKKKPRTVPPPPKTDP